MKKGKTESQKISDRQKKADKLKKELEFVETNKLRVAYEKLGDKIVKTYRNASALEIYTNPSKSYTRTIYNVLWSNVQVQKPLGFARLPKTICERMHKDSDPIGRLASELVERGMTTLLSTQKDEFMFAVSSAFEDRLLPGMGTCVVEYDSDYASNQDNDKVAGEELGPNTIDTGETTEQDETQQIPEEFIKPYSERIRFKYIFWQDWYTNICRNWYEVRTFFKDAYLTRAECIERFGEEIGKAIPLTHNPNGKNKKEYADSMRDSVLQARIVEAWDKPSKTITWFCPDYDGEILDEVSDPYELDGFLPSPMPLMATTTTDSIIPTPDYKIYERLAEELDEVTFRLSAMMECVRVVGMHAGSIGEDIKNMLKLEDGQTWPVKNYMQFMEKGGLAGAINWFPIDQCIAAIPVLQQYQSLLLGQIDEITGIPDIVRGSTDPSETAAAIQRKSRWTILKATTKQQDVQRFCRDLLYKAAQLLFNPKLFTQETLAQMCGYGQLLPEKQALYPDAIALLQDDRLRTFRIDIETDSTIAIDEEEDQAARSEYIQAVTQLMNAVQSVQQFRPELMNPMIESAMFTIRAFRSGRALEGSWERAIQQIEQNDAQAAQNPPQPPPDAAMMQVQVEQQKVQQDAQLKAQQLELDAQKAQNDFEIESQKVQLQAQQIMGKQSAEEMKAQLTKFQEEFKQWIESQRLALEAQATRQAQEERLLEESRLAKEQNLEAIRLVHDRIADLEPKIAEAKPVAQPQIVVVKGSGVKRHKMVRAADGSWDGESREVEEA